MRTVILVYIYIYICSQKCTGGYTDNNICIPCRNACTEHRHAIMGFGLCVLDYVFLAMRVALDYVFLAMRLWALDYLAVADFSRFSMQWISKYTYTHILYGYAQYILYNTYCTYCTYYTINTVHTVHCTYCSRFSRQWISNV